VPAGRLACRLRSTPGCTACTRLPRCSNASRWLQDQREGREDPIGSGQPDESELCRQRLAHDREVVLSCQACFPMNLDVQGLGQSRPSPLGATTWFGTSKPLKMRPSKSPAVSSEAACARRRFGCCHF
jgi:hypothetical protein